MNRKARKRQNLCLGDQNSFLYAEDSQPPLPDHSLVQTTNYRCFFPIYVPPLLSGGFTVSCGM